MLNRRKLISHLGLGALSLNIPLPSLAQGNLSSVLLKDNIYLVSGAGCNILVAEGADSLLVVDGGLAQYSAQVLDQLDKIGGGKPVATLFNTNWRDEHCGLNHALTNSSIDIIAHENTRLWQNANFQVAWENRQHDPLPENVQANRTFYKKDSLVFNSEKVNYGFISQAHTDGDIYIYFSDANVLAVGDMLNPESYLLLDYVTGGWISGAQKTTAGLIEMVNEDTIVVAANGKVSGLAELQQQKEMLDHAYDQVANAYRTGRSLDQFAATDPMAPFNQVYGDAALFVELLYRGTWYHVPGRAIQGII